MLTKCINILIYVYWTGSPYYYSQNCQKQEQKTDGSGNMYARERLSNYPIFYSFLLDMYLANKNYVQKKKIRHL